MWNGARIAVIIPACNEARLLGKTLSTIPSYVDMIYVVDDASTDETAAHAAHADRVQLLQHSVNRGVGAAIVTGYQAALQAGADVLAVMAGDNQMHPDDLAGLLEPVVDGTADYVKGNRFLHANAHHMPRLRYWAGRALGIATRMVTGFAISDPQCGYTAFSAQAARSIPLHQLWPRYGYPNDLLCLLAAHKMRVRDVPVRPVYASEASGIRPWHTLIILGLLTRRALQRLEP